MPEEKLDLRSVYLSALLNKVLYDVAEEDAPLYVDPLCAMKICLSISNIFLSFTTIVKCMYIYVLSPMNSY